MPSAAPDCGPHARPTGIQPRSKGGSRGRSALRKAPAPTGAPAPRRVDRHPGSQSAPSETRNIATARARSRRPAAPGSGPSGRTGPRAVGSADKAKARRKAGSVPQGSCGVPTRAAGRAAAEGQRSWESCSTGRPHCAVARLDIVSIPLGHRDGPLPRQQRRIQHRYSFSLLIERRSFYEEAVE